MARDRSLDEFLGGEQRDPDDETDEADETDPDDEPIESESSEALDDAVEPAVSTYAFSPDGASCAACGTVVQKRWRDDGELVCPDCKRW